MYFPKIKTSVFPSLHKDHSNKEFKKLWIEVCKEQPILRVIAKAIINECGLNGDRESIKSLLYGIAITYLSCRITYDAEKTAQSCQNCNHLVVM